MMKPGTIYALSSGLGKAGISVVRVSGPRAREILCGVAGNVPPPRRAVVRLLSDGRLGDLLDRAVVIWLPGPDTATGEDIAEFHVHGSAAVVSGLFAAFGGFEDARPAEPGEFTRRAFANGRMDLVEVEGLADLLNARTNRQRQQAMLHLMGNASCVYDGWRSELLGILARVEAAVDFVEEAGVAEAALDHMRPDVEKLAASMTEALLSADRGAAIRDGVKVVLCGPPNTGKSSLLNCLARREAAIVTPLPGTTRDAIEVTVEIEGLPVILTDTAGLRGQSPDSIELLGMERTLRAADEGDLIVWVCAPDVPGSEIVWPKVDPSLIVCNKVDLGAMRSGLLRNDNPGLPIVTASTVSEAGVSRLTEQLARIIREKYQPTELPVIVRMRQKQAICDSIRFLNNSLTHDHRRLELVAEDLREVAQCLGRITGRIDVEDLLAAIFSEFCIGK
jgi:tRNA modification GTPase